MTLLLQDHNEPDVSGKQISYYSALSLLRGKVYDALENHGRAVKWYQAALKADPFCYEAFQVISSIRSIACNCEFLTGSAIVKNSRTNYCSQQQPCIADSD